MRNGTGIERGRSAMVLMDRVITVALWRGRVTRKQSRGRAFVVVVLEKTVVAVDDGNGVIGVGAAGRVPVAGELRQTRRGAQHVGRR